MWCILKRNYWYRGLEGYHIMNRVRKENRAKWPHKFLDDPLEEHHALTVPKKYDPQLPHIDRLVEYTLNHPSINLAPHALSYLFYHGAKHNHFQDLL